MQASTAYGQPERELAAAVAVPPELLETVARAVAAALVPPPRQPAPSDTEAADFLAAAQIPRWLEVSRETVRRLAISGALPHTVVCRGSRKTTRRFSRRFAEEFAASGLEVADLAASPPPGGRGSPRPHGDGQQAAAPQPGCASAFCRALA